MDKPLPPFKVGEREKKILRYLARYRFLSFKQVAALDGGSQQQLSRRLQLMLLYELISEPATEKAQLRMITMPRIFALAKAGAEILRLEYGMIIDRRRLKEKNARATTDLVAHTLDIANTMLAFERGADALNMPLLQGRDLIPYFPEATRKAKTPFALTLTTMARKDVPHSSVPDTIFSLFPSADSRLNFIHEEDTAEEPTSRKKLIGQRSWFRHAFIYWHGWKAGAFTEQWDFKRVRVLTVTRSELRIANMIDRTLEMTGRPTGLFLFTTKDLITEHGAFAPIWIGLDGKTVPLLQPALEEVPA